MAKRLTAYRVIRGAAIALGAGLSAYSAHLTWQFSHDPTGPIAAVVGAGMFIFAEHAWQHRRRFRAAAFAVLATVAAVISGAAVLERSSATHDARTQERRSENLPREQAQKALEAAEAEAATREAAAAAECSTGRGRRCAALEERATEGRQLVDKARAKIVQLGARTAEDPAAQRVAALLPWISAQMYAMAMPAVPPLWLELSGPLLLAYGLSPKRRKARRRKVKRKAAARKKRAPRKPAAVSGGSNVVQIRRRRT